MICLNRTHPRACASPFGMTPAMHACKKGHPEAVQNLASGLTEPLTQPGPVVHNNPGGVFLCRQSLAAPCMAL